MNSVENIETLLRDAVLALSLPADEQCRVTLPGCVSCELLNDFDNTYECYLGYCAERLTTEQEKTLAKLNEIIDLISEDDFRCFDTSVLGRPIWTTLRQAAGDAVILFGWQGMSLEPFTEK